MAKGIPFIDRDQEKEKFSAMYETSGEDKKEIKK
jgi:hypothetical protein